MSRLFATLRGASTRFNASIGLRAAAAAGAASIAAVGVARYNGAAECAETPLQSIAKGAMPSQAVLSGRDMLPSEMVLSGDCGGTNTRLVLFLVNAGEKAVKGKVPKGKVIYEKHYRNAESKSFVDCMQTFLSETDKLTGGVRPAVCCLACAGGIKNNSVSFTNVKDGWTIDGTALQSTLGIKKVKLINDFEAQGYGLLTLADSEVIKLNKAEPVPGAPIACVGAGTGLGECYLTSSSNGAYTCWPSEGGHAEFSPRSSLTYELTGWLRAKLAFDTAAAPEKIEEYFGQFDTDKNGTIDLKEFSEAIKGWDISGIKPRRVSVERVVSGPGLAAIYGFLRAHWAFRSHVERKWDTIWEDAARDKRGAIVAQCAAGGNSVCAKAVEVFNSCYGSEVGVAALKWLPYGGLYVSGGIAAKNPEWVQSADFMEAYKDKGRMSNLVMNVPLYLVTVEDTGERGALFYAVMMLQGDA